MANGPPPGATALDAISTEVEIIEQPESFLTQLKAKRCISMAAMAIDEHDDESFAYIVEHDDDAIDTAYIVRFGDESESDDDGPGPLVDFSSSDGELLRVGPHRRTTIIEEAKNTTMNRYHLS